MRNLNKYSRIYVVIIVLILVLSIGGFMLWRSIVNAEPVPAVTIQGLPSSTFIGENVSFDLVF